MQHVNGVPVFTDDPTQHYDGLDVEPTWFSAQGGVYKCRERSTHKEVAIKKYLVEETDQYPDLFVMPKELVENEIYTMTKCVHPNILKLLGVYLHQEFVYLIMPYCSGGSLQQYVFDHLLNIGQLVHIIKSIASGLAEVHRHGYIHRDIKCDNIFLDEASNSIVIGDFGVVSITPAADSNVEEAGVVLFWSPELVNRKIVHSKVDIWALGIVILEMLNGGKAPYEDEQLEEDEIKARILEQGKPEYPEGLPSRLVDLLDMCLALDPRARASANDILKHPFLCHYEPEPLFPIQDTTTASVSEPSEHLSVDEDVDLPRHHEGGEDTDMVNALNKLRALETLHDFDIGLQNEQAQIHQGDVEDEEAEPEPPMTQSPAASSPSPTPSAENEPTTPPLDATPIKKKQPDIRRCRLPQPSFIVKEQEALSLTAQEKVMSVLRKRQTITDEHRSQGSRLPMLKAMTLPSMKSRKPVSSPPSTANKKVVRRAKSVRLPKETEEKPSKPVRSHSMYKKSLNATTPPPQPPVKRPESSREKRESSLRSPKPRVLFAAGVDEPKKRPSAYRKKRLPPGESRTARLMMGISTTGRDTSKQRRPLSLVPETTRTTPLPRAEKSSRRQSTPNTTTKKSNDVVPTKSAALKSAKVVRVH